jgi:hypothetical protein
MVRARFDDIGLGMVKSPLGSVCTQNPSHDSRYRTDQVFEWESSAGKPCAGKPTYRALRPPCDWVLNVRQCPGVKRNDMLAQLPQSPAACPCTQNCRRHRGTQPQSQRRTWCCDFPRKRIRGLAIDQPSSPPVLPNPVRQASPTRAFRLAENWADPDRVANQFNRYPRSWPTLPLDVYFA